MFAFINLISAFIWATITITLAYIFGEELLAILHWVKEHFYLALPLALILGGSIMWYFQHYTKKIVLEKI